MLEMLFTGQLAVLAVWSLVAWRLDAYGRRALTPGPYDAIVVPGCAVRSDGQPSGALARRVRHAIILYREGRASRLIFTGGVGRHPPAESAVAANMALTAGVPDHAIFSEEHSTTTRENAHYAAQVSPTAAEWAILVVTDNYHCWRARKLFAHYFDNVHCAGSTPGPRLRVRGSMREVVSIIKMMLYPTSNANK